MRAVFASTVDLIAIILVIAKHSYHFVLPVSQQVRVIDEAQPFVAIFPFWYVHPHKLRNEFAVAFGRNEK
jgi:hypothetical protein